MLDAMLANLQAGTRISVSCGLTAPGALTRTDTVARWRATQADAQGHVRAWRHQGCVHCDHHGYRGRGRRVRGD